MSRFSNWSSARWTLAGAIMTVLALLIIPPWRVVAADKEGSRSATTNPSHAGSAEQDPAGATNRSERPSVMGSASHHRIELSGQIEAPAVILMPPMTGVLEKVNVRDGQSVRKGDVLFELDDRKAQADVQIAQATTQLARSELLRTKTGVAQNAVSKEELETNEAKLEIAQANLDLAMLELNQSRIRAPFDGVVHTRVIAGMQVANGTNIGEVIQIDSLGASFSLSQTMIGRVKVGQEVQIRTHSDAHPIKAQISSIAPIVDEGTGTVGVQARLVEKASRLLPGMSVTVSIEPASGGDGNPDALKR